MKKKCSITVAMFILSFLSITTTLTGQSEVIKLPPPQKTGGLPLMEALSQRKTQRQFSTKPLPEQTLSNLLWAADGVNRPDGKRTAPSARNYQEINIYVALKKGLFLYDPKNNTLVMKRKKDIRETVGVQKFTQVAPVGLIYVSDLKKLGKLNAEDQIFYSATDTGFISQNVYLFCASEKLATVVMGWVDKPALKKEMELSDEQMIVLSQAVGFPK